MNAGSKPSEVGENIFENGFRDVRAMIKNCLAMP